MRARDILQRLAQLALFALIVRPFLAVFMGLTVLHRRHLPAQGPALLIANHNSHLDTLALMAALPLSVLWQVRPVAAADHFAAGLRGWLARCFMRVILIERHGGLAGLDPVLAALDRGEIVIFFPEGSRGEPEVLAPFRRGIAHLAAARPAVPVVPAYLHNMGRCMPRGAWLLVPFSCQMIVGARADLTGVAVADTPAHLRDLVGALAQQAVPLPWDLTAGHGLGDP